MAKAHKAETKEAYDARLAKQAAKFLPGQTRLTQNSLSGRAKNVAAGSHHKKPRVRQSNTPKSGHKEE